MNFEDLYKTYAADIYRFSFWLTGDTHRAEDVTSETFIRAWTKRDTICTETLKAYIITIARNIVLEQNRKCKNQISLDEVYPDPCPGPDKVFQARHELQRIHMVLERLPEIDRSAFVLRVFQELPYEEIARILGLSQSAAKVKVHRVRKMIMNVYIRKEVTRHEHNT